MYSSITPNGLFFFFLGVAFFPLETKALPKTWELSCKPLQAEVFSRSSISMQTRRWYCKRCGSPNPESSSTCGYCGKKR